MTTIEIFTKQRADVPALEIDDADLLDPDVTIDMPAPLRSGTIRVRLEYAGPGKPLETTDPRESEDLCQDG